MDNQGGRLREFMLATWMKTRKSYLKEKYKFRILKAKRNGEWCELGMRRMMILSRFKGQQTSKPI